MGFFADGAGVAVTVIIASVGVVGDGAGVAVTVMIVSVGVVGDGAGVAVTIMVVAIGVCGDVAGVAVLFVTAIVGMSGSDAVTVNMTVGASTAGTVLFAFGAVGMAIARVRRASNVEMNRPRIVCERLLEWLVNWVRSSRTEKKGVRNKMSAGSFYELR